MKSRIYIAISFIFLTFVLLSSIFVIAAGTSTVPDLTAEETTDHGDPVDPVPVIKAEPTCRAGTSYDSDTGECEKTDCPEGCRCNGNVIACPDTNNENSVNRHRSDIKETIIESKEKIETASANNNCDSLTHRGLRIACRLKNHKDKPNVKEPDYDKQAPEACRSLKNPTACISLYKKVKINKCYTLHGRNKDKCFKKTLDVTKAKLNDLPKEERIQKAREHLILLLYELQERIELANQQGSISDEDATDIIDLIVLIKQQLLDQEKKSDILPNLNELKQKIRFHRTGKETE
jgi:hypothetical protein